MRSPSFLTSLLVPALLVAAQSRTTEQGEAQISSAYLRLCHFPAHPLPDPSVECSLYYYAPVGQAVSAGKFPPVWTPATIIPNDTIALAKYQSIQSQIPNISPNGQQPGSLQGNWSNFTYPPTDPNCWWTYHQCTTPKLAGLPPDLAAVPEPGTLGYGFDDGPNCSHNAFYDFLQQNNQKASMFFIGSNVLDWPLEAQRALADGHEIGVRKCPLLFSSCPLTSFQTLGLTMQAIKLVTGITPTSWRPPFGDVDDRVRAIAHALGLRTIIWQYDSNDWRANTGNITVADVDANYQALIQRAQNGTFSNAGTIMLTHELNNFTMSEGVKFYNQLKAAFKHLVPMGVAVNISQPYVETNYSLPNFAQYIAGTTTLSASAASPTGSSGHSSGSSGSSGSQGTSGAVPSFSALGGLAVSAAFVGSILRLLM
ncbi:carbohydrate esterase family 4 protein [Boletus reticuloceps]|uniref:chitin deacetylase n=1 Tax=Boletus reticuloceps TaxID=495285 RepID=A0A8I3A6T7_9AGAM|nr:carbohydrate esterase family 4 protein [Boletus reticuloceps]